MGSSSRDLILMGVARPEDDLRHAFYTRPEEMGEIGRQGQHNRLHQQLSLFSRLADEATQRYSIHHMHEMLRVVSRGIPVSRGSRLVAKASKPPLTSLQELQDALVRMRDPRRRGLLKQEEEHVTRFFADFFQKIEGFRDLRRHFDERIHACLYRFFYDPSDDVRDEVGTRQEEQTMAVRQGSRSSVTSSSQSRRLVKRKINSRSQRDRQASGGRNRVGAVYGSVDELQHLCSSWDSLLSDSPLSQQHFSSHSAQAISHISPVPEYELLLRLLPELQHIMTQAVTLARAWWTSADRVYNTALPGSQDGRLAVRRKMSSLRRQVSDLRHEVAGDKDEVESRRAELQLLLQRGRRLPRLTEALQRCEHTRDSLMMRRDMLQLHRQDLEDRVRDLPPGAPYAGSYLRSLDRLEQELATLDNDIQTWNYQVELHESDFFVELGCRPDFVSSSLLLQNTVGQLEESLQKRREEKARAERHLDTARHNCRQLELRLGEPVLPAIAPAPGEQPTVLVIQLTEAQSDNERQSTMEPEADAQTVPVVELTRSDSERQDEREEVMEDSEAEESDDEEDEPTARRRPQGFSHTRDLVARELKILQAAEAESFFLTQQSFTSGRESSRLRPRSTLASDVMSRQTSPAMS